MDLSNWKNMGRERVRPLILTLDRWGFSPLTVSIAGVVITLIGAWIVAEGHLFLGTLVFLIGSAFDMLDGGLARLQGTVSRRGAFLDSVLDRFGEAAFLIGIAVFYMERGGRNWDTAVVLILVTMFGSLATSYVRARAEGVGETCLVGWLQRTERVILLSVGALLGAHLLYVALWVLAIATVATTIQRIVHVAKKLPGPDPANRRDVQAEAAEAAAAATAGEVETDASVDKLEPMTDEPVKPTDPEDRL